MKKSQLFLILGIVLVSLGGVVFLTGAVLTLMGNAQIGDLIMGLSALFGAGALVLLVLRLSFMAKNPDDYPEYKPQPKVIVKVVDVAVTAAIVVTVVASIVLVADHAPELVYPV